MKAKNPQEIIVMMEDNSWIWPHVAKALGQQPHPVLRLRPNAPIRHSWNRFQKAPLIVIHWESPSRSGGALVEEIFEIDPHFEAYKRLIILTSDPLHEDVVYFGELGLRKIVRVRNREKDAEVWVKELEQFSRDGLTLDTKVTGSAENQWRKLLHHIDMLGREPKPEVIHDCLARLEKLTSLAGEQFTARSFDARACLAARLGQKAQALEMWNSALAQNPNFFRAYNHMIEFYIDEKDYPKALALLQKMQLLNKSRVSRLVQMGNIHMALNDEKKAEFCFQSALDRDEYCSGALNGLAEIKFYQGQLDAARDLLEKSQIAYKCASALNKKGILLVQKSDFKGALDHYSKAQYVLPQQEKGPQLFYNIALCYARWGKMSMAKEFAKLSLIKAPDYKRAHKLLEQVNERKDILISAA